MGKRKRESSAGREFVPQGSGLTVSGGRKTEGKNRHSKNKLEIREFDTGLETFQSWEICFGDQPSVKDVRALFDHVAASDWTYSLEEVMPRFEKAAKEVWKRFKRDEPTANNFLSPSEMWDAGPLGVAAYFAGQVLYRAKALRAARDRGDMAQVGLQGIWLGRHFEAMLKAHHGPSAKGGRQRLLALRKGRETAEAGKKQRAQERKLQCRSEMEAKIKLGLTRSAAARACERASRRDAIEEDPTAKGISRSTYYRSVD